MYFYEILKEVMDEKGMTVADVAKVCNLTDSTVRSIFDRKAKRVSLDVAFSLCRGLGVSLERLNTGDNGGKVKRLGTLFADITVALGLNVPDLMEDLGVSRRAILRIIDNKNSDLEEFQKLEEVYGIPRSVWAGKLSFRVWIHSLTHSNKDLTIDSLYQQLNENGKARARELLDDMVKSGKYSA